MKLKKQRKASDGSPYGSRPRNRRSVRRISLIVLPVLAAFSAVAFAALSLVTRVDDLDAELATTVSDFEAEKRTTDREIDRTRDDLRQVASRLASVAGELDRVSSDVEFALGFSFDSTIRSISQDIDALVTSISRLDFRLDQAETDINSVDRCLDNLQLRESYLGSSYYLSC